jgi:hypothetical protein
VFVLHTNKHGEEAKMNVYESEARLLFARERADLLASEMRAARRTQPSRSVFSRSTGFLARLRRLGFPRQHRRAAQAEM